MAPHGTSGSIPLILYLQLVLVFNLINLSVGSECPGGTFWYSPWEKCMLCLEGRYREANGGAECVDCPHGTTVERGEGRSVADCKELECPSGQYMSESSTWCYDCPDGTYRLEGSGDKTCQNCPDGTYVASGRGTQITDCMDCPAGRFRDSRDSSRCEPCDGGSYRAVGGGFSCTKCPAGTTVARGKGTDISDCRPCPAGQYPNPYQYSGASLCWDCPMGHYSAEGSAECRACPWGTTVASGEGTERSDCTGCAAGYYLLSSYATKQCRPCDKGSYSLADAASCTRCPSGTRVVEGVGRNVSDCIGCPAGQYLRSSRGGTILKCQNCSAGQYSEGNVARCNICPTGSTVPPGMGKSLSDCQFCPAGQYVDATSDFPNKECKNCFKGYYNPGKEESCQQCPFGTTVDAGLGQSVDNCTRGDTFQLVDREGRSVVAGKEGLLLYRGGVVCTGNISSSRARPDEQLVEYPGTAICRWLGFDRVQSITNGLKFGDFQTSKRTELDQVRCSSTDLSTCTRRERSATDEMSYTCKDHQNDIFLTCAMGCPAGEFKNVNGSCEECPEGTFTTIGSSVAPKLGKSETDCIGCPAGQYLHSNGSAYECRNCSYAQYSEGRAARCAYCPRGSTVLPGMGRSLSDCQYCSAGQYLHYFEMFRSGPNECRNCSEGHYKYDGEFCFKCPFGTTVDAGMGRSEEDCTKGDTFQLVDKQGNSVGAWKEGLLLYKSGIVCTLRSLEDPGMAICRWLGFDGIQSTSQGLKYGDFQTSKQYELADVICDNSSDVSTCSGRVQDFGNYAVYGRDCLHDEHQSDVFLTCTAGCPPGEFRNWNGTCESCPEGMFSTGNKTSCSKCAAGTSVPMGTRGISPDSCQWGLCEGGHYRNDTGSCLPCPKGFYSTANRLDTCKPCPSGTTVAAGEGTHVGECIAVGGFKAFSSLNEDLAEIEENLQSLKKGLQGLIGKKLDKKESIGDEEEEETASSPCEVGHYSGGDDVCYTCPDGKTVAAGQGTEYGDCVPIGEFRAFELLKEKVVGIESKISDLEKLVSSGESLKKTWKKEMKKQKKKKKPSKNRKNKEQ